MKLSEGLTCCVGYLGIERFGVKRACETAALPVFDVFLESDERIYRDILFS